MRRQFILTACLLMCVASNRAHADKVDDYIRVQMQRRHIPGLSLAVVKDGKVLKAKGYGLANVETHTPATAETVYKIASVSKQFLAAGIMLLMQDGKLGLDDKISKYLDDLPDTWKGITIRRLLTHTSGLIREAPGSDPYKVKPDDEVIKTAYPLPLVFAAGEKWEYSNVGYFTLAEIIHRVSGKSWSAFLTERIFAPVGMTATRTTTTTEVVSHRACGYSWDDTELVIAANWLELRPSGAFLSTVSDFAKWDAALYTDNILKSSSRDQMWTPVVLNSGATHPYGFGWFVDDWQGHRRVYHSGGLPGFQSEFDRFINDKLTVIVLINTDEADAEKLALNVAGFYVPALTPPVLKPIPDREPLITAKVKTMIDGFVGNNLDMNLFTSKVAAGYPEAAKSRMAVKLRSPGTIQSIELIEHKDQGSDHQYRYRVIYKSDSLFFIVSFDKDGKIDGWGMEPE